LGVCNGCQLMVELDLLHPEHSEKPKMEHNESGKFESQNDVIDILDDLKQLLKDIQLQAKVGKKLFSDSSESGQRADYELYVSDIEIGNIAAKFTGSLDEETAPIWPAH